MGRLIPIALERGQPRRHQSSLFMNQFKSSHILIQEEEIANELKRRRQEKKISLEKVSVDLKISLEYLQAMESGEFDVLPIGMYRKNFLKEYLIYLNLDYKVWLKDFDNKAETENKKQNPFSKKIIKNYKLIIFPKIIRNLLVVAVVFICLLYLVISLNNIISPPFLEVSNPASDIISNNQYIDIIGITEPESQVVINNEAVLVNQSGIFTKRIDLNKGINKITVIASKKYSRDNVIIRQILVK